MGAQLKKIGNLEREAVYQVREMFSYGREASLWVWDEELKENIRDLAELALYPEKPLLSFREENWEEEEEDRGYSFERDMELFRLQKQFGSGQQVRRLITCGGVDDGKSTLIGRILFDTKSGKEQEDICKDSEYLRKDGSVDYALLAGATKEEARQGITVRVSYSVFEWKGQKFLMADVPGHEEYTHHMAFAASKSDTAILTLAANKGIVPQTRRHTRICYFMGIREMIFAVNKMDMVSYDEKIFNQIAKEVRQMMEEYTECTYTIVPIAAKGGENMIKPFSKMAWYAGNSLLETLKKERSITKRAEEYFCMPVQRICKSSQMKDAVVPKRVIQGEVVFGSLKVGDEVFVYPTGSHAAVSAIYSLNQKTNAIEKGEAAGIELDRELDVGRGYILTNEDVLTSTDRIEAELLWMSENRLSQGKRYHARIGTVQIPAVVTKIYYQIDVNTGERRHTEHLTKNGLARCEICLSKPIAAVCENENRELGSVRLIDSRTNGLAACGNVIRTISDEAWKEDGREVSKEEREDAMGQKAGLILFTEGARIRERMNYMERYLLRMGFHTIQTSKTHHIRGFLDAGLIVLALVQLPEQKTAVHMLKKEEPLFDCTEGIEKDEDLRVILKRIAACF